MSDSYLSFDTGIDDNRVYIHRGDIFICAGLFKELDSIDKDDHILAKPDRPVIVISANHFNRNIVKVLPFSTRQGVDDEGYITSGRVIRTPGINNSPNPSYIDVSQVFTVNTYQLKIKLGHASQDIVDAAVAMHTLQNIQDNSSIDMLVRIFQVRYPKASVFNQFNQPKSVEYLNVSQAPVNNMYAPGEDMFADVKRVTLEELEDASGVTPLKLPENRDEAYALYTEWLEIGTDLFRQKYGITRQQYVMLRDRCVQHMIGKVERFTKYSWNV